MRLKNMSRYIYVVEDNWILEETFGSHTRLVEGVSSMTTTTRQIDEDEEEEATACGELGSEDEAEAKEAMHADMMSRASGRVDKDDEGNRMSG